MAGVSHSAQSSVSQVNSPFQAATPMPMMSVTVK